MDSKENIKKKTLSALFYSFSEYIINSLVQLVFFVVLARLLLPQDYGLIGMIVIFISISQLFIDGGMTTALIREKNPTNEDFSTVFFYNLILSIIIYIILFVFAKSISSFFNEPILIAIIRVIGLNLIIGSFGIIQKTILIINLDFKTQMNVEVVAVVVSGIIAIFLAYNGFGVWSLVVQMLSKQIIASTLFMFHNKWVPLFVFRYETFKKLFGFGSKILLTGLLATVYNNIYNIIIGKNYSSIQLGYYTKSLQTSEIAANSITTSLNRVSYPVFSKLRDDPIQLRYSFKKVIKNASFITFPMMVGLIVIAKPMIYLFFGEKWIEMVPYFQILCLAGMTVPHRALNTNILKVLGRSDLVLKLDIIKTMIGLLSIFIVVYLNLGIYGLVWTTFINANIAFFINSFFSGEFIFYSTIDQTKDIIKITFVTISMGGLVYLYGYLTPVYNFTSLFIQLFVGVISYLLLSKILKVEELDSMITLLKQMLAGLRNR